VASRRDDSIRGVCFPDVPPSKTLSKSLRSEDATMIKVRLLFISPDDHFSVIPESVWATPLGFPN